MINAMMIRLFCLPLTLGEELCDHHLFRKAMPYEGSAHIPMIISRKAALSKDGSPQVCHSVVELRDVLCQPLLEMAGVPVPESVDGSSLLPL